MAGAFAELDTKVTAATRGSSGALSRAWAGRTRTYDYAEIGSGTAGAADTTPFLWAQQLASVRFATSSFL
jgi:hypothetical protein